MVSQASNGKYDAYMCGPEENEQATEPDRVGVRSGTVNPPPRSLFWRFGRFGGFGVGLGDLHA